MAKKKYNRLKHQKDASLDDTSEEEFNTVNNQGRSCPHVARGIHFGRVKKSIKSAQNIVTCNGCNNEKSDLDELPEIWLCLQCGYRGCGRTAENQHGLQHFKTLHSDCHSLVLSTTVGSVWCYDCDDEISLESSRVLKQCVEFVMKMAPKTANKSNISSVNNPVAHQNLQNSVIKEETSVQNAEENIAAEKSKKPIKNNKQVPEKIHIKGLRNLGNTCFFNAVMQNLTQTSILYFELKNTCNPSHLWEVPELVFVNNEVAESEDSNAFKLSLPRQLPLTNSLLNFLDQMREVSSAKVEVINPSPLFGEISKKCPQFRHFQQQDSHELLRQLLDGIRQEEIKRQKKSILRHFDLENVSPENVDDEMKKQIKAYGCYASHTIVEKIFGGLLISTVLCEECKASSQVFEPFMDLSLPLFEEKQHENNEVYGMLDGGKQDHIKPLRNKKTDWDSDENTQKEYALSKPKNDPGKPSKHQEKKLKQLAKKEKKRAKNSARNRKNSLNENCDANNEPNENKEDVNDDDDKDSEEPSQVDHEDEEVWEVKELFGPDEKNDDVETAVRQSTPEPTNVTSPKNEKIISLTDSKELQNCVNAVNLVACSEISTGEVTQVFESQTDDQKVVEEQDQLMDNEVAYNCPASTNQSAETEEDGQNLVEISHESLKNQKEGLYDENQKESVEENERPENQKGHLEANAESKNKQAEDIVGDVLNPDNSLESLTTDFDNCLNITNPNQSDIDDRIQALSLQVKDVRIRRDSDRQENLLNSSESADDYESQKTSPKSSVEDSCSFDNCDNWSHSVSEQQTKDWISKTLTTLKPRHHVSPLECSVNSCLSHFTKPELLTGSNKFRCENCTELKIKKTGNKKDVVYSNASKQLLIFSPPAILTLHLKRFQQVGMSLRKVNRFVEFPLILDLAPFCCSASSILPHMSSVEDEILYSLYGVVEHSGRLTSGHYTAYVKANKASFNRTFECLLPLAQCNLEQMLRKFSGVKTELPGSSTEKEKENYQWFYVSDSHVKEVTETQVLKCQAYLLFYERIK